MGWNVFGKPYHVKIHDSRTGKPRPSETFKTQSYPAASPQDWKEKFRLNILEQGAGQYSKWLISINWNKRTMWILPNSPSHKVIRKGIWLISSTLKLDERQPLTDGIQHFWDEGVKCWPIRGCHSEHHQSIFKSVQLQNKNKNHSLNIYIQTVGNYILLSISSIFCCW